MGFERTDDLKADILRLFVVLVKEHGYDGATFQMIADILGITKGAITYHFKNKHHIAGTLISEFFDTLRTYIAQFPELYRNEYWRHSTVYIMAYRTILNKLDNEHFFYHKAQVGLWSSTKVTTVLNIYRDIVTDFHKNFTEEELLSSVYMDLGARNRIYQEYTEGNPIYTVDKFCYYHVYLIGCLCRLDETTIRENIRLAFDFADKHTPPLTPVFA